MTTPEALARASIPPLFYSATEGPTLWGSHGAYEHLFTVLLKKFGISKYQFAKLLGKQFQDDFRNYFNGKSRPSSNILGKTILLDQMYQADFPLVLMRSIWWESDPIIIMWKDGSESSPNVLTGAWDEVPSPSGKPGGEMRRPLGDRASKAIPKARFKQMEPIPVPRE